MPEAPIVFMKLPTSAAAPNSADQRGPAVVRRLDYEGELAVVMGAGWRGRRDTRSPTTSRRATCSGASRSGPARRDSTGSCPYGPWITTADEVPDPHDLALRTWVNGELRQDSGTSDLIFKVPELVAFLRETCTLEPGDLILTGTPSGVGMALDPPQFLQPGDVVKIEIDRLGSIEHAVA